MIALSAREARDIALKTHPVAKAAGWSKGQHINREEWLTRIAQRDIAPLLAAHAKGALKPYRVSVGWPKGSRGGAGAESIGQCWPAHRSSDKHHELFISPLLGAFEAAEVLIHELVHVAAGLECNHKGEFKRIAQAVGLTGKMTATKADEELAKRIRAWIADMPAYPHGPMTHDEGSAKEPKPGSRLLKSSCEGCEYTVRVTQKWIDIAAPTCPNPDCDGYGQEMRIES